MLSSIVDMERAPSLGDSDSGAESGVLLQRLLVTDRPSCTRNTTLCPWGSIRCLCQHHSSLQECQTFWTQRLLVIYLFVMSSALELATLVRPFKFGTSFDILTVILYAGPIAAVIALHIPDVRVTVVDRVQCESMRRRVGICSSAWFASQEMEEPADKPNLIFSTACTAMIAQADMILISVNTPTKRRGVGAGRATDMTALEGATRDVATHARAGTIMVEKSTVPRKTGQLIKDIVHILGFGVLETESAVCKPLGLIEIITDPYTACAHANAVLVLTDWDMFKNTPQNTIPAKPTSHTIESTAPSDILHIRPEHKKTPPAKK